MSKSRFSITNSHMARRVFRRSKSAQFPVSEMMTNTSGLHKLCSRLSQENIEKLSSFRMEANIIQAQMGREAIDVEEALGYLKACQFSSTKAIDIFKNHQKSRETYHLEDLRPYREPLCSSIGARKMEVVGTTDSEGYPIVLFTVCRHETFKSDHKSDMQLLFYTLDQASESEAAREKGIVFIIDFRDSHMSDIRYISSVVSVLKEGYPIHTKMIYGVSTKRLTKIISAFQKMVKYDLNKMKIVDFTELGSYFLPEQLPLSLGGMYVPRTTSPTHHHQVDLVKDDFYVGLQGSSQPSATEHRAPNNSRSKAAEQPHPSSNGSGGGRSVNRLLELFEGGTESQSSAKPPPAHSPIRQRPVPPSRPNKPPKKGVSQSAGDQQQQQGQQGQVFKQVVLKKTPQHTHSAEGEPQQAQAFQVLLKKAHGSEVDTGKGKVPLLPPNGRRNQLKAVAKSNSVDPDSGKKHAVRAFPPYSTTKVKEDASKSDNSKRSPDASISGSSILAGVLKKTTPTASNQPSKTTRKESSDDFSTSCNLHKSPPGFFDRRRADSAGSHASKKVLSASSSPKRPHVPVQVLSESKQPLSNEPIIPRSSSDSGSKSSPMIQKRRYENVSPKMSSRNPPQSKPCPPQSLSQDDQEYENMSFSNRDSDAYEPINIGFGGLGRHMDGPYPPLPPTKQSAPSSKQQNYENVEIGKSLAKSKTSKEKAAEEDDEMLFGKEGPPGMQETIYENFGSDKGNRYMSIEELAAHVDELEKKGLSTEYLRVRNEPITGAHKACRLPCNTAKNRYKDVICYDETRVPLNGKEGSDYIHANYVDGYKKPNAFILTQGPKDKTVADFWRMMWEQYVLVVVMVTKCVEVGKRKCAQYWPESGAGPVKHGNYAVTVNKVQNCDGYDLTFLQVSCKGVERTILHFQFLAWPDYGIPSSGSSIVRLILDVRCAQEKACRSYAGPHPIVVHCSAGVGRSGAFCSLDNCIHEIDEKKKVNFQGVVRKMRKQRAFAIQTEEQYEFCYRTLLEYAKR